MAVDGGGDFHAYTWAVPCTLCGKLGPQQPAAPQVPAVQGTLWAIPACSDTVTPLWPWCPPGNLMSWMEDAMRHLLGLLISPSRSIGGP